MNCVPQKCIELSHSGGSRISRGWGANPKGGDANLLFWLNFRNNCMKIKQNWTEVACPYAPPPTPTVSAKAYCFATSEADTMKIVAASTVQH